MGPKSRNGDGSVGGNAQSIAGSFKSLGSMFSKSKGKGRRGGGSDDDDRGSVRSGGSVAYPQELDADSQDNRGGKSVFVLSLPRK